MTKQKELFQIERFAAEIGEPWLVLDLPWPPSVNHYWVQFVAGKRVVVTIGKAGRQYREAVAKIAKDMDVDVVHGRLSVEVRARMPDSRRRDLDNVQKALLDALAKGGAYRDDSQIDRLVVERGPVMPGGKVLVEITQINPPKP